MLEMLRKVSLYQRKLVHFVLFMIYYDCIVCDCTSCLYWSFYWLNLKWPSNAQSFGSFASHGSSVCRQRDILFAKDLFETSNPRRFLQDFCEYHKLEWIGRPCSNADTQAIQERLNRVKARKWYRPVAPMIAEEALEQVFGKRVHSTYMSMAPRVQDWVSGMVWRVPGRIFSFRFWASWIWRLHRQQNSSPPTALGRMQYGPNFLPWCILMALLGISQSARVMNPGFMLYFLLLGRGLVLQHWSTQASTPKARRKFKVAEKYNIFCHVRVIVRFLRHRVIIGFQKLTNSYKTHTAYF